MSAHMTPRREAVLRALVEEYIRTAEPVPSQALADKYRLGYSPATIRIDLKTLEEDGLVYQRHTSGGRIPSADGYRYFVEHLMLESTLSADEQQLIRHMFYQVQGQLDQWARLSATILSQFLGGAAVVTTPRAVSDSSIKHIAIIALNDPIALLVVALTDGTVPQTRIFLEYAQPQDELSRMADAMNQRFAGYGLAAVEAFISSLQMDSLGVNERTLLLGLEQLLRQQNMWSADDIYQAGLTRILSQPEFSRFGDDQERSERMQSLIEALETNNLLPMLHSQTAQEGNVQVVIGGETEQTQLRDISFVLSRYGNPGKAGGVIGVIGPTRMQYSRAVAIVRYITQVMTDLLDNYVEPAAETYEDADTAQQDSDAAPAPVDEAS